MISSKSMLMRKWHLSTGRYSRTHLSNGPWRVPRRSMHPQSTKMTDTETPVDSELPRFIPERTVDEGRTLVLCLDGTGDQFDSDVSNVVSLVAMLKKDNSDKQLVYYLAGIGTHIAPTKAAPSQSESKILLAQIQKFGLNTLSNISKLLDEAFAYTLDRHVRRAYEFLMQNYKAGDRICIFGFSRGAYTARALSGMIYKVGLLPRSNYQQVPFAYRMYTDDTEEGWRQSNTFKKTFSVDVPIEFVGVWDTVRSVGLISRQLPFTESNKIIRVFRHAVSLDEHRAKFNVKLWYRRNPKDDTKGVDGQKPEKKPPRSRGYYDHRMEWHFDQLHTEETGHNSDTDTKEVWFAGCHRDIGGGAVKNEVVHSLARIPLRWMVRECFKVNSGIMFDTDGLRKVGIDPTNLYPHVKPRPPPISTEGKIIQSITEAEETDPNAGSEQSMTEEEHELKDALSPIHDPLSLNKITLEAFWWILEYLPFRQEYQRSNYTQIASWMLHRGRGRIVPRQKKETIAVHRTVKMRMEAGHKDEVNKYKPRASIEVARENKTIEWVD